MFLGNYLRWPVSRDVRRIRFRVIEPSHYEPEAHAAIFNAVLQDLISAPVEPLDPFADKISFGPVGEDCDLVTFPEAFLAAEDLLSTLSMLERWNAPTACIHVGLRPSAENESHLFSFAQLSTLTQDLEARSEIVRADLTAFRKWLAQQRAGFHFNIACVFAMDAESRLRMCLHPKLVRSKFERSPLPEEDLAEGNLLTLITLDPVKKTLMTVTVQPLICSDALNTGTDLGEDPPLRAVNRSADCFGTMPPDHVDIVSVATCSPQQEGETLHQRAWHDQFLEAFLATQSGDLPRHNFASFVLSNFLHVPTASQPNKAKGAGLSGVFMPIGCDQRHLHDEVAIFHRVKKSGEQERWTRPHDEVDKDARKLKFLAALKPSSADFSVRIFGFTMDRLPRDNPISEEFPKGLVHCSVRTATRKEGGILEFSHGV